MDFKSLTYFVTVARELNITKAAAMLNMSQPPLSNQIKQLEEEIGTQLFVRNKRGLSLTPTGTILLRRANQILELASNTRREITYYETKMSGELKIGVVEGRAPFLLSQWLSGFCEEFPLVSYTVRSGSSDDLLDQLNNHVIDLAVIAAPYNQEMLTGICVGRVPWVVIIPRSHPLAGREGSSIPLSALENEALIIPERGSRVAAIEQWFMEKNLTPNIRCKTSHYVDAVSLVEQGIGLCIFPQSTYTPNPHIVTRILTEPPKYAEYVMVHLKRSVMSELSEAFWDYVTDYIEEAQASGCSGDGTRKRDEFAIPEGAVML